MRIVQINICDNGSTGKIMLDIFNSLDDNIEKKAYVSLQYKENQMVKRIHSIWGYRLHKFFAMYLGLDEYGSYFETKRLIRELKKNRPDVLHLHNIHSHTINYKLLFDYIKQDNIKVVWTLHDCWAFTGGCPHFELNNCYKWKTQCEKCEYLRDAGVLTSINRIKKQFKEKKKAFLGVKDMTIVCPSKWLANLVAHSFLKDYPIAVINNGINLENFKPIDNHTFDKIIDRSKKILLGVASPFTDKKGYGDFIKLSKILPSEYQIVMVGLSNEQIQKLPNNIIGIRRTNNQQELAELYSLAYVFVNFTYEDTFSMVNIEALSCGTPVICYNTGGAIEMLNTDNSIIIGQSEYAKLVSILSSVDKLKECTIKNIDDIRTKYSCQVMCENYNKLYLGK